MLQRKFSEAHDEIPKPDVALGDLRFRNLLSHEEWQALPLAVRKRFSKRLAAGDTVLYAGQVTETRMNRLGWFICQCARLIGSPLPTFTDANITAAVSVTEDARTGGQMWTRLYARRNKFPQVVYSCKRFAGPTGLEEYVGHGVGMALRVHVENGVLLFRSAFYFLEIGPMRLRLPGWLTPGALTVGHDEIGEGRFQFTLNVEHPLFGVLIHQTAVFRETKP